MIVPEIQRGDSCFGVLEHFSAHMCTTDSKVYKNPFFNHAQSIGEDFERLAVKVPEIQRGDIRFLF